MAEWCDVFVCGVRQIPKWVKERGQRSGTADLVEAAHRWSNGRARMEEKACAARCCCWFRSFLLLLLGDRCSCRAADVRRKDAKAKSCSSWAVGDRGGARQMELNSAINGNILCDARVGNGCETEERRETSVIIQCVCWMRFWRMLIGWKGALKG